MKQKMDLRLKKNCDEPEAKDGKKSKEETKEKKKFDPKKWNKR